MFVCNDQSNYQPICKSINQSVTICIHLYIRSTYKYVSSQYGQQGRGRNEVRTWHHMKSYPKEGQSETNYSLIVS